MICLKTGSKSGSHLVLTVSVFFLALALGAGVVYAQENLDDADITSAIEWELLIDDAINMNVIDVETNDGIVTFKGTVNNILTRDRVVRVAESVKGVRAVVNRIDVSPAIMRPDEEVRKAVSKALLDDPAADAYEIDVSVTNGVVTLSGTVQSWAEKQLAEKVTKGIIGVHDIENDLTIHYKLSRSDYEIQQDIEARLANDVRIDDYAIDVNVNNGKVKLSGIIGSLAEKRRAESDGWVAGVKSVDTNKLDVEWWARNEMQRKNFYASRSDQEIEDAVEDAFLNDPRVLSFNPDVQVNHGTVTLTGVVDNLEAKKAAEQDARNTAGVWRVKNHLKVRPETIPSNGELENRIESALLLDPYVERYDINIDAYSGLVYLTGQVNTSFEKHQAAVVAEGVKGVTEVINNITFKEEWDWKPDWEIREDIKEQLTWSLFVNEDDVNVIVEDGVATLSGSVDSWGEYNAAENNAYDGGAKDVQNNLTVLYPYYGPYYPYDYWGYPY